ncbi:FRG domain-containing protein [Vibrio rumoiensis]|uniref:FRG domain-containing protein n=1 Tax=Vibrio rumoiensis 1S-45 TaxID=1188252 RepID=A0A1E5E283_9VIBR|nr:FRG domain-containing protein [Vibrio rumoiensis]OEF25531.1 hypothetical protein A1QC_01220 [Vibrio rumoiensis 1S-45]
MKEINEINSVSTYIDAVDSLNYSKVPLLFRGPSDSKPDLLPSIARPEFINVALSESELLSTMHKYKSQALKTNSWSLICEAMDEGLPTRLMEWMVNPLVALWLACQPQHNHPAVFVLNANEDRKVDIKTVTATLNKTVVFEMSDITFKRADEQRWCTLHPIMAHLDNEILPLEEELLNSDELIVIRVSKSSCSKILEELVSYGFKLNNDTVNLSILTKSFNKEFHSDFVKKDRQKIIERFSDSMSPTMNDLNQYGKKYHVDFDFD